MNRVFGAVVIVAWVVAMTALIRRDVVPFWTAREVPSQIVTEGAFQAAIYNGSGVRFGTSWVTTTPTPNITTIRSTTILDLRAIANMLPVQEPMIFDTKLVYRPDGVLDQFRFQLEGARMPIQVVGERCGPDFACTTSFGRDEKRVSLDGRLSECLAETLRPFCHLKDLHVGQRWRIRLLDPFSLLCGQSPKLKMQLVTVTRREAIDHQGGEVACYRIETDGTVAWADDSGRVLRQEVQIPLLGRLVLMDEPFDRDARLTAVASVMNDQKTMHATTGENTQP
ncbi:MAG: hypothetical protein JXQ75_23455 [Phycisphaerae bacterium]|nr:hypothetical protein [Phycisphaerae bacterium]